MAKSHGGKDPPPDPNHDPFEFLRQVKASSYPFVLTLDGGPKLVVKDAFGYQRLLEIAEREAHMEDLRLSIEDMRAGRVVPAEEVFAELRQMIAESRATKSR